jgi:thioredoxin-related protein
MRVFATRLSALLPLVTTVVLALPKTAPAAEPVAWRTDYNSARREAIDKGLPLFVVVGTDNCYYCKKLEAGPCRDAAIAQQLASNFIPLKIDATREPNLAKALKVQVYPTIVLAGPDGKIHSFLEGYLEADRLGEQLKRAITAVATSDWAARDFELASRAIASGDYPRAVSLLKGITKEYRERPIGVKSQQVLEDVERLAAARLARARELEQRGFPQESMDTLAEIVRSYAGTEVAADAASRMSGLASRPETQEKLRARTARDLLALAREEFRAGRYYDCLQKCDQLAAFSELAESREGAALSTEIKSNPERLAIVCDQMNQRTATMYLALAESWVKKGQVTAAIACYEKVSRLCPNTQQGDLALTEVAKLRANGAATPATLTKP